MPKCCTLFTQAENALIMSQFWELRQIAGPHHPAVVRFLDLYNAEVESDIAEVQMYNIRVAARSIMNLRLNGRY